VNPAAWYTLGDVLREHARAHPGATAAVCGPGRWTWAELDQRVDRLAASLAGLGVGPGDRVLWLGQNCHRILELLIAAGRLGAATCVANWRQTPDELAFVVDDLEPCVVVAQHAEIGERVAQTRDSSAWAERAHWLFHDTTGEDSYEALVSATHPNRRSFTGIRRKRNASSNTTGGSPQPAFVSRDTAEKERQFQEDAGPPPTAPAVLPETVDPEAPVLILYTAAFDGRPNGALLPHRALLAQGLIALTLGLAEPGDVYLNSGPLFHVGTFKTTIATFLAGGTNVFTPRVDAEELCRLIAAERCTGAFLQPPTVEQMVAVNADGRHDLSSLRAKPGPPEWNAMVSVDDRPLPRSGYGQTELAGVVTYRDPAHPCLGAAGRPGPLALVDVVDPAGGSLPPGAVGELVVRGPMVMTGYHRRPELTEARRRGGWHHTGDLGRREADGSLSFIGPMTRLIKSAAENIYPAEVEACLRAHPAVVDAAVIGVPDATWGQSVKAVVVLGEGRAATGAELVAHCRARIASYKKPRTVEFAAALPRRDGRVDYDDLDARYGGGGYPGSR
jgi:acyl-CoA synthetase (AMP-forming)/AMP-acid ligase II